MQTDPSNSLYYDYLRKLNPVVSSIGNLSEYNCPENTPYNTKEYINNRSLLFIGTTPSFVKYDGHEPIALIQYALIFAVGKDGNGQPIAPSNVDDYANFDECHFYNEFFVYMPDKINTIACYGNKCRYDFTVAETGLWCESCNGDFDNVYGLSQIMYEEISFNVIPKESIYFIHKIETPIKHNNVASLTMVKEVILADKQRVMAIQDNIAVTQIRIDRFIQEQMDLKKQNEEYLQKLLAEYGSLDQIDERLSSVDNKIRLIEDSAARQEARLKLEVEEAELQKKMMEIRAKITELGT